jgi:hypothetical protein
MALNCEGNDRTGRSASQQRFVRIVTIWFDMGKVKDTSSDNAFCSASVHKDGRSTVIPPDQKKPIYRTLRGCAVVTTAGKI